MCLLIFAHRVDDRYPLVLAANRDEFHRRATAPAQFWDDHPQLLAGRDLEGGGTWMGLTRCGRFAAITNYRDPSRSAPAPRSRGELPLHYLTAGDSPTDYLQSIAASAREYAGFNLLLGDGNTLWYFSNSRTGGKAEPRELEPGIYGLSNAHLDTPWPKVELGKSRLEQVIAGGALDHKSLAAVVSDRRLAEPEPLHQQGLGQEMEQILSAQFIVTGEYGTRSTTTLWLEGSGAAHWRESSFDAAGEEISRQKFILDPQGEEQT